MNNRSGGNESNLDNFSPDLESLNELELDKEPLLSFPFDHLYACHSQSSDCGQSLTLDKNVIQPDEAIKAKDAVISSLRTQNKKLKELLIYHLDLIQQQNDVITNREKSSNTVQEEGTSTQQVDKPVVKHQTLAQRHLKPPPLFHVPTTSTVTSASPSQDDAPQPLLFSSLSEILGSESNLYSSERSKPFGHDPFDMGRPSEALPEMPEYISTDLPAILDSSLPSLQPDFSMIEGLTPVKKVVKPPEPPPKTTRVPNYTITTNSGIPIIQKNKNSQRPSCIGSLSRMPKKPKPEPSTIYDNEINDVNNRAQMLSTYGKSKINSLRYPYAGSLSDRLQLIDTTPTGEDPYQLGEAEMREQSPIPRLVMSKNNRVRAHTGEGFGNRTNPATTTRCIYDPEPESKPKKNKKTSKGKTNRGKSASSQIATTTSALTAMSTSIKAAKANVIEKRNTTWEPFCKITKQTSLGDFSYGETSANLPVPIKASVGELVSSGKHLPSATLVSSSNMNLYTSCKLEAMDINKMTYSQIFQTPPGDENENVVVSEPAFVPETTEPKTKKRGARTTSLAGSSTVGEDGTVEIARGAESKRGGRKRALSSASGTKREKAPPKPRSSRGRGGYRGKRGSWIPVPPLTTRKPYHTAMGHPDISWYLGHDPDVKKEDVEQLAENTSSNVEVPSWRMSQFASLTSAEGTENTDDEAFQKRHQKLETEERRQLRWHMRRVREQRHVERLRLRHRDPWAVTSHTTPTTYTVWPSPLRDLQFIEITDILPVLAFGEDIPNLPEVNFKLPWVKTSKAQKRSKRSKTLH